MVNRKIVCRCAHVNDDEEELRFPLKKLFSKSFWRLFLAVVMLLCICACAKQSLPNTTTNTAITTQSIKNTTASFVNDEWLEGEMMSIATTHEKTDSQITTTQRKTEVTTVIEEYPPKKQVLALPEGISESIFSVKKESLTKDEQGTLTDYYQDKEGNIYGFNRQKGSLSVIELKENSSNITNEKKMGEDELWEIADSVVSRMMDFKKISRLRSSLVDGMFFYTRKVNGYSSKEGALVKLTPSGKLISAYVYNPGLFDGVKISEMNQEKMDKVLESMIQEKYGEEMKIKEIHNRTLNYENNLLELEYTFTLDRGDGTTSGEMWTIPIK